MNINKVKTNINENILFVLLILRIPLLFLGQLEIINNVVAAVIYLIMTYFLIALFIIRNYRFLEGYYITKSSVILFILAPVLGIWSNSYDITNWIKMVIAMGLIYFLFRKGYFSKKSNSNPIQILVNSIIIILFLVGFLLLNKKLGIKMTSTIGRYDFKGILEAIAFQLSFAAISEEPVFRGILMGGLEKKGLSPILAILVQGVIFWFSHIYYINTGVNFWIIHPLVAISLGLIVYLTKSITNSIIMHSLFNSMGNIMKYLNF